MRSFGVILTVALAFTVACGDDAPEVQDTGSTSMAGSTSAGSTTIDASGSAADSSSGGIATGCIPDAAAALRTCFIEHSAALRDCYGSGDAPCDDDDAALTGPLDDLQASVESSCSDGEFLGLDVTAVTGRLRNACASESSSLAWRTFGGPHGQVWSEASDEDRACLLDVHVSAVNLLDSSLDAIGSCLAAGSCADIEGIREEIDREAFDELSGHCPGLDEIIALDASAYTSRTSNQVDCLVAAGQPDPADVPLNCGPSNVDFDAPRGTWTQIPVDGEKWGTLCGDGSDYAFWLRLAPEGEPLDRVVIALQGGGVCLFEEDCAARMQSAPGLFHAMDDMPLGLGIASDDPEESPFANWTKVYLPYCNQDVFAGGGVVEQLGSIEVPRYGSINLRSSIRMVRDYLWRELDAAGGAGFRPDEVVTLFGGFSAGAYGANYNYHWLLDDLQWPRTMAFPDAGLGLDNGSPLGVSGLGVIKIPAWGMQPNLPPYCFAGDCAVGPVLFEALSPRLLQVPQQQMLVLTNPRDQTQQGDAFFEDEATWINAVRQAYCDTSALPGIEWYLTSVSDQSIHVVSVRPELWSGEVDGESMRDWFVRAVEDPQSLRSRAEEADFVNDIDGVEPFPCEVAP